MEHALGPQLEQSLKSFCDIVRMHNQDWVILFIISWVLGQNGNEDVILQHGIVAEGSTW